MSGGYFDYEQYKITRIADDVEHLILTNNSPKLNEWGEKIGRGYSPEVIAEFRKGLDLLRQAAVYAQRIDWLMSGDDGEGGFLTRLQSDLSELRTRDRDA